MQLTASEARALLTRAFSVHCRAEVAQSVATALVAAEQDGQRGHGFSRIDSYLAQAASGKVDGQATPTSHWRDQLLEVDAAQGFAYPALDLAIDALLARAAPLAGASIRRSHHAGQLGRTVERLAEGGLVALMVANTPEAIAPWGGQKPLFGTNPIAFAAPRAGQPPLVIDLSLSVVARGKIVAAQQAGEKIPSGWARDAAGQPTSDPNAALKGGSMAPIADAKGSALALMVEVLAATLTGSNPGFQASSFFTADGPPPGVGQLILALRPDGGFTARMETLMAAILAQPGTRLPGSSRLLARRRPLLELDDAQYSRLRALG